MSLSETGCTNLIQSTYEGFIQCNYGYKICDILPYLTFNCNIVTDFFVSRVIYNKWVFVCSDAFEFPHNLLIPIL